MLIEPDIKTKFYLVYLIKQYQHGGQVCSSDDTTSMGNWISTFRDNVVSLHISTLEDKDKCCLETSRSNYPLEQRNVREEWNPQPQLQIRNSQSIQIAILNYFLSKKYLEKK